MSNKIYQYAANGVQCKILRNGIDAVYVEYKSAGIAAGMESNKLRNLYNHCKAMCATFATPSKARYFSLDHIVNSAVAKPQFFERNGIDVAFFTLLKKRVLAEEASWEACVELQEVTPSTHEATSASAQDAPTYTADTGVNLNEVKELREQLHASEVRVNSLTRENRDLHAKLEALTRDNKQLHAKLEQTSKVVSDKARDLSHEREAIASLEASLQDALQGQAKAEEAAMRFAAQVEEEKSKGQSEMADLKRHAASLEAKLAGLSVEKLTVEEENLDLQLGAKTGANPIEALVTSRKFNMVFIGFVMGATFLAAFTKFMASLTANAVLLDTMSGVTFFIISLALAFGVVWFSYNKSEKAWINATVLVVLFLCEWVSFSKFTGLETGWDALDNGRDWIFSIFLPVLTLLLAKMQSTKAMRIEINDAVNLMRQAMRRNGVPNIAQIVIDLKKEMLKGRKSL